MKTLCLLLSLFSFPCKQATAQNQSTVSVQVFTNATAASGNSGVIINVGQNNHILEAVMTGCSDDNVFINLQASFNQSTWFNIGAINRALGRESTGPVIGPDGRAQLVATGSFKYLRANYSLMDGGCTLNAWYTGSFGPSANQVNQDLGFKTYYGTSFATLGPWITGGISTAGLDTSYRGTPNVNCNESVPLVTAVSGILRLKVGATGTNIYVCGYTISTESISSLLFTSGTGTQCGTSTDNLTGNMYMPAGSTLSISPSPIPIIKTTALGDSLCVTIGAGTVNGVIAISQF